MRGVRRSWAGWLAWGGLAGCVATAAAGCASAGARGAGGATGAVAGAGVLAGGEGRGLELALPPTADEYSTVARPEGVVGGAAADNLTRSIAEALRARGSSAVPDGALGATATWMLRQALDGPKIQAAGSDGAARRFGFVGSVLAAAAFPLGATSGADLWREALADVTPNLPITRYGVSALPDGSAAAVVFGGVELTLEPFPRHLRPGQTLALRGETADRFSFAHVYLTDAGGRVIEKRLPGRRVEASFQLGAPGVYKIEVMGDGATGPVVLANVPVYVGVPEPADADGRGAGTAGTGTAGAGGRPATPAEAEVRMLALLNAARAAAGVGPVQADAELRAVALAHSQDMIAGHFFGHVSPTRGTVDDRIRRAAVAVSAAGENIAQAETPEAAHDLLMESPGHRANMVAARFTHVGIGVVPAMSDGSELLATLVFGRRPTVAASSVTPAALRAAVAELRREKGVRPAANDPVLQAAAEAGAQALASGAASSPQQALAAANEALRREAQRAGVARKAGCVQLMELLELDQLEQYPILLSPGVHRMGLALGKRSDARGTWLVVLALVEGVSCS